MTSADILVVSAKKLGCMNLNAQNNNMTFLAYKTVIGYNVKSDKGNGETSELLSTLIACNCVNEPILPGIVPLSLLLDRSLIRSQVKDGCGHHSSVLTRSASSRSYRSCLE